MFIINGTRWDVVYVRPYSSMLMRSDGTYTIGVADNTKKVIFIDDTLRGDKLERVLAHELTHVHAFEYNYSLPIDVEEIVADFISLHGRNIINITDKILSGYIWRQAS